MDAEAREQIISYLLGETTLADLDEWLTTSTWEVEASTPETEIALDALVLLAEHARGDRTDAEFDDRLRRLLATARIGEAPAFVTTADSVTERASWGWTQPQTVPADRRLAEAPG